MMRHLRTDFLTAAVGHHYEKQPLDGTPYHSRMWTANFHRTHFLLCMAASAKDTVQLAVKIRPLGDRVVVRPLEKEQTTASGIVIPDTATGEKPQEGVVLALGKGGVSKDTANPGEFLKVGDRVLFGKYAGDDVKLKSTDGKDIEVKVLHLDSILGVVES